MINTNSLTFATWNINSFKVREPNIIDWLHSDGANIDVLCLQELKMLEPNWQKLTDLGWRNIACHAQKTYNGVAIVSKIPFLSMHDIDFNIAENKSLTEEFHNSLIAKGLDGFVSQARVVAVNLLIKNKNIRLINVYVPNGESLESDKFQFKLLWLDFFHQYIELTKQKVKYDFLLVCGDFNIAPLPCDISSAWKSPLLRSPQELTGFEKLLNCGLIDVLGQLDLENEPLFTWWDYRMKSFERNLGLRIDHWLIDSEAFEHLSQCWVDKKPRTQEKPSDHIPVCITLQLS